MEKVVGFKALPQEIDNCVYLGKRWPLVIDVEGKAASFLRYKGGVVNAMFPDEVTEEKLRNVLVGSLKSGTWLTFNFDVFEGDLSSFFSPGFPETVLDVKETMKQEFLTSLAKPEELKCGKDELVPRAGFKLIIVTKRPVPSQWSLEHFFILRIDHAQVQSEKQELSDFRAVRLPEEERKRNDALIEACFDGEALTSVQEQIAAGADVWHVNISGETCLTEAALKGQLDIVRWLLTVDGVGLDPNHRNGKGQTALFNAAYNGHKEVVQVLLENGADPTIRTKTMESPSGAALNDETRAIIDAWDVTRVANIRREKERLRDEMAEAKFRSDLEREQYYLAKQRAALVKAATNGNWPALEDLLLEGGDVESRDEYGKSLLNICANSGFDRIVEQLVENHEANIENSDCLGWTPLMSAAHNNHEKVVRYLLGKGASTEMTNSYGKDVFALAHEEIAPMLASFRPKVEENAPLVPSEESKVAVGEESKSPSSKKAGKGKAGDKKSGAKKATAKPGKAISSKPGDKKAAGKKK